MIDGNTLLTEVGSKYGAPMGRQTIETNPNAKVILFRMTMVDGDYDAGGAYWGGTDTPMYAAIGDGFRYYFRCQSLTEAKIELLNQYPRLTIETTEVNDNFVNSYIKTALYSSNDESDDSGRNPLDDNYCRSDIAEESITEMIYDCRKFLEQYGHMITPENCLNGECFEHAGRDFWYTRNHHGAGFWDGDWADDVEDLLTKASQTFGGCDLYIGDDGKIYCS